ncbi:MAG TPA: hypothetical protein VFQ89_03200, partial [Candidatus Binatia bacterium]|nr:hypothetical protein [Candidatus Binatia bacterium]
VQFADERAVDQACGVDVDEFGVWHRHQPLSGCLVNPHRCKSRMWKIVGDAIMKKRLERDTPAAEWLVAG